MDTCVGDVRVKYDSSLNRALNSTSLHCGSFSHPMLPFSFLSKWRVANFMGHNAAFLFASSWTVLDTFCMQLAQQKRLDTIIYRCFCADSHRSRLSWALCVPLHCCRPQFHWNVHASDPSKSSSQQHSIHAHKTSKLYSNVRAHNDQR